MGLKKKTVAILLTGGTGERFKSDLPKQFHRMSGKPIYLHTLEKFLKHANFDQILLPVPPCYKDTAQKEIASLYPGEAIEVIEGGKTRQESSYLALLACPKETEFVMIHDAVRPFVSRAILKANLEAVTLHGAVDTCISSADTLVRSKEGCWIDTIPSRKELLRGQTPQTFAFSLILKAHEKALLDSVENASDDCSLVLRLGYPVKIVPGEETNIKITTEFDLFLAEQILSYPRLEENTFQNISLEGKVFAITGASGGIGKALCEKLRALGATPVEIAQTAGELQADLTQYSEVEKVFKTIANTYGSIDGLINGIGTFQVKDFDLLSQEEIKSTIDANLMSVIYCCQCAQIKKGGHIVNVSSSSYSKGRKESLIYSASKAAVVNFTQGLAEARPDLCINVVVPQRTDTPLRKNQFPEEESLSLLKPEEVAEKISSLLKSSSHTGTILEVRKKY
jgi:2-C-methyl-D-erythritol 4-phosphate cytidylyltransferase